MPLELEEREYFRYYEVSLDEKKKINKKLTEELIRHNEIKLALLFGSFLENSVFRDIDVAVYVYPLNDLLDYKFELERELTNKLNYPVDITILNDAPPWFALTVFQNGIPLIERYSLLYEKLFKKTIDEYQRFK